MRILAGIVLIALAILSTMTSGAYAAPEPSSRVVGPYEGTFEGRAYGDEGSLAPLSLELIHRGREVEGTVVLGEGLYVNGGWCGAVNVPAATEHVQGTTDHWNPKHLQVSPTFDGGGFDLTVDFESSLSTDGERIAAKAKIDLPWFCGRDPVLRAYLYRG